MLNVIARTAKMGLAACCVQGIGQGGNVCRLQHGSRYYSFKDKAPVGNKLRGGTSAAARLAIAGAWARLASLEPPKRMTASCSVELSFWIVGV